VVYAKDAPLGTMPEALVVDVPKYTGPEFYPGQPTWVPILPMESFTNCGTRTQLPVVAGFALTVNKAQGLTIEEGVVINLVGSKRFRPASKHGLCFVAYTRSESFDMTAFKGLPPWEDFVKGRSSDMLQTRLAFTAKLEKMHRRTVAKYSSMKTEGDEDAAYEEWKEEQERKPKRRKGAEEREGARCEACQKLWG